MHTECGPSTNGGIVAIYAKHFSQRNTEDQWCQWLATAILKQEATFPTMHQSMFVLNLKIADRCYPALSCGLIVVFSHAYWLGSLLEWDVQMSTSKNPFQCVPPLDV
ncbi:hypothetical protein CEXT_126461 [Caerostris extrusa]|uniref:Uncharacterized protein n=1 Tax=Caerostris extrusa TaxID=172846 RepID=A0AAV4P045_CAEEX|nr:hypothetical protein CEXT_126461 [Caerostris extrusa]